ncbi:BON domain-containing protein [Neorhizobium sp. JUb45]|uniref:BON domain-containing protein n=1 Tax=unclassified Neorhizobium TaxID=2629175 RepID=UPI001050F129|nr:BON domain-containing protein [Neorhizobium sp. JUb45]TCR05063.1 BON domain-containing protein [Neorhizobium sp. JUb45]
MALKKSENDLSREEDFRDYEARDIDEGWPYADKPGATSKQVDNAAYGASGNFDRERNGGFRVDGIEADGQENRLRDRGLPETVGRENDDDLEERISDALENLEDLQMEMIDLHVDDTTVVLEGMVDDDALIRRIVATVQRVPGVGRVVSRITAGGVDSHIPDDDE